MLDYTDCAGRNDFTQENLADWLGIGTTTHGGYVRTVCGVFPNLRDVFTYADLEASITLPSGVTDFRICGVAPYEYAGCDAPDCAGAVALGGVQVAVAGSAVTVTADSITLPSVGYLGGIDPPGGSFDPGLRIVGTVTYGGAQRYAVLNVDWRYDGVSANEASLSVLGPCVPTSTCPDESTAYSQGYDVGYACGTSEPPPDCPPEIVAAYEAGFADGWSDGSCGPLCPDESTAYSQGYDVGYACGTSEPPPDCPPEIVAAYEAGHAQGWSDNGCV